MRLSLGTMIHVCGAVVVALAATAAQAEIRRAVLVGNSNYSDVPLENPRHDANLMAQTLIELGFEVVLYHDVMAAQSPLMLERIKEHLSGADVSLFYYAGHGLQHQGKNLLLPIDADLKSVDGITSAGTSLNEVLQFLTADPNGIKILVLDACRNNIVPGNEDDLQPGFSFIEAPKGEVLIAFSTAAGETALDSGGGNNSPYTAALSNAFQQYGADIYDVFRTVRGTVRASTGGRQIPWITGSIETEYVFRNESGALVAESTTTAGPLTAQTISGEIISVDRVLWEYLRTGADPRDLERFALVFPQSNFAGEAKLRGVELASQSGETVVAPDGELSAISIANSIEEELSGVAEASARSEQILVQAGSYVMRDSFRTWPLRMPQTKNGLRSMVTECDEESADPVDPDKLSPGISAAGVSVRRALRACAFDLAADPDNPRLLFQFARVLEIAKKFEWANAFHDRAIEKNYSAAMVARGFNARIGRGQERDESLAFELYRRAAEQGNPRARTNLGNAFLRGEGVEKNMEEGVLWLRLAASMGWPHATNALGDVYRLGRAIEEDPTEAVSLYRSAAEQGQTTAMANLGVAYLKGNGVEQDHIEGLEWLDKSMALGNGFAPVYAGQFYMSGGGAIAADVQKARELFEAATRRGNPRGYLELATRYSRGAFSGKPDLKAAYRNALFAKRGRIGKADELITEIGPQLTDAERMAIEDEVKQFIRQNGI